MWTNLMAFGSDSHFPLEGLTPCADDFPSPVRSYVLYERRQKATAMNDGQNKNHVPSFHVTVEKMGSEWDFLAIEVKGVLWPSAPLILHWTSTRLPNRRFVSLPRVGIHAYCVSPR